MYIGMELVDPAGLESLVVVGPGNCLTDGSCLKTHWWFGLVRESRKLGRPIVRKKTFCSPAQVTSSVQVLFAYAECDEQTP